jgi:hypothetical protein
LITSDSVIHKATNDSFPHRDDAASTVFLDGDPCVQGSFQDRCDIFWLSRPTFQIAALPWLEAVLDRWAAVANLVVIIGRRDRRATSHLAPPST